MCGQIEAVGVVESSRLLLGDEYGGLHVLAMVSVPGQANVNLTIELLGETSIATNLCYLDAGIVFVASHCGDSQLIRLLPEREEVTQSCVELLDSYTNLGPITSMCVVDVDKQGRGQLVTCSGARKDGSLRVVRNGVGMDDQCSVDLPGIKGMWSVKKTKESQYHAYLVQSFSTESRVLGFDESQMETEDEEQMLTELTPSRVFDSEAPTLYCGNVDADIVCQVTPTRVRFMRCSTLDDESLSEPTSLVSDWTPPNAGRITVASAVVESDEFALALALTGKSVAIVSGKPDVPVKYIQMEHEVACLSLSKEFLAVGLWSDLSVRIIHLASQKEVHREKSLGKMPFQGPLS